MPEDSLNDASTVDIEAESLTEQTEADDNRDKEQALDIQETLTDDAYEKELRKFIIPKLRSASYRWKYRSEAIKKARISRGLYRCAMCKGAFKNKEFAVDHVVPVVALDGWNGNLDVYIRRMLVKTEGWQILCHLCHDMKTDTEVQIRKMHRERKRNENPKKLK